MENENENVEQVKIMENENENENVEQPTEQTESVEVTRRVHVPRAKFMQVWEETVKGLKDGTLSGSGVEIVANTLGLKKTSVQQRSTKYRRKRGLELSFMPRGGGATFNGDKAQEELAAIKANLSASKQDEANEQTETE